MADFCAECEQRLETSGLADAVQHLKICGDDLASLMTEWFSTLWLRCLPSDMHVFLLDRLFANGREGLYEFVCAIMVSSRARRRRRR